MRNETAILCDRFRLVRTFLSSSFSLSLERLPSLEIRKKEEGKEYLNEKEKEELKRKVLKLLLDGKIERKKEQNGNMFERHNR